MLGVTIDRGPTFNEHISNLCKRVNRNVICLSRIRRYISFNQAKLLLNSYILSIFNYCPIIWMFCGVVQYKLIISTQTRALKAISMDYASSFRDLLRKCNGVHIHELHLRSLICEIYKTLADINPSFMRTFFPLKRINYSLCKRNLLVLPPTSTVRFGNRSFLFRGSMLWNSLSDMVKASPSVDCFKKTNLVPFVYPKFAHANYMAWQFFFLIYIIYIICNL